MYNKTQKPKKLDNYIRSIFDRVSLTYYMMMIQQNAGYEDSIIYSKRTKRKSFLFSSVQRRCWHVINKNSGAANDKQKVIHVSCLPALSLIHMASQR